MTGITETESPERSPIHVYVFDRVTGEYIGQSQADPDPMDSSNWLIPASSTTEEPAQTGNEEVAVRIGGKYGSWEIKLDKRGTEYWLPDRSKHVIKEIGEDLPPDALLEEPPVPVEDQFQAEMDALNSKYKAQNERLSADYVVAIARDGTAEQVKVAAIRQKIDELDAQYIADKIAINEKYEGM